MCPDVRESFVVRIVIPLAGRVAPEVDGLVREGSYGDELAGFAMRDCATGTGCYGAVVDLDFEAEGERLAAA